MAILDSAGIGALGGVCINVWDVSKATSFGRRHSDGLTSLGEIMRKRTDHPGGANWRRLKIIGWNQLPSIAPFKRLTRNTGEERDNVS